MNKKGMMMAVYLDPAITMTVSAVARKVTVVNLY